MSSPSREQLREQHIEDDMGESYGALVRRSDLDRKLFDLLYHPRTELAIFFLVVLSIALLVVEVSTPERGPVGWLGGLAAREVTNWFFWVDLAITLVFVVEYALKLHLAPRKLYFIRSSWLDLLAILPILRVFRIGRVARLLRLLRLLRVARVGQGVARRLASWSDDVGRQAADNLIIGVYLVFSVLFGAVGVLVFEKGQGSGFETLGDGLWWCVVTLTTVGYGDKFPVTTGGKFVASFVMFTGLGFFALLTGMLSSMLIERSRRREERELEAMELRDHVVICNWNANAPRLIDDLLESDARSHIVVLCARDDIPTRSHRRVHYVRVDPATLAGLEQGRVTSARVAVVLADAGGQTRQDTDARSILIALAIEKLARGVHTIVEILDQDNEFHLQNAGVDEILVSGAYTGTMLSQAVQTPGLSDVFGDLFEVGAGSQLREVPIVPELENKPFSEVAGRCFRDGKGVLVGYRRARQLDLSPATDVPLQRGDRLVLISRLHTP